MTDEQSNDQVPEPQGYFWGLPYDWRRRLGRQLVLGVPSRPGRAVPPRRLSVPTPRRSRSKAVASLRNSAAIMRERS
jgi:hypothetical protein